MRLTMTWATRLTCRILMAILATELEGINAERDAWMQRKDNFVKRKDEAAEQRDAVKRQKCAVAEDGQQLLGSASTSNQWGQGAPGEQWEPGSCG